MIIILFLLSQAAFAQCEIELTLHTPRRMRVRMEDFEKNAVAVSARLPGDQTVYQLIHESREFAFVLPFTRFQALQKPFTQIQTVPLSGFKIGETIPIVRDPTKVVIVKNGQTFLFAVVHPDYLLPEDIQSSFARISLTQLLKHFLVLANRIQTEKIYLILQIEGRDAAVLTLNQSQGDSVAGKYSYTDALKVRLPELIYKYLKLKQSLLLQIDSRTVVDIQPLL